MNVLRAQNFKKESGKQQNDQIKTLLKEVLYNSLSQAVIKLILSPHYILKAFLSIVVVGSSGIASYLVVKSILTYLSYGINTTSRTIYERSSIFPKITICNQNRFISEYAVEVLSKISIDALNINILDSSQTLNLNQSFKKKNFRDIDDIATYEINAMSFSDEMRKNLSHDFEDILLDCSFNADECYSNDFLWKFHKVKKCIISKKNTWRITGSKYCSG